MPSSFLTRRPLPTARRAGPSRTVDGWRLAPAAAARSADAACRDLACPVHQSLERWVLRHLGSVAHERRVADLATDLFDVARPLHGLGSADLRLLRWAAVVHDVGRAVCDDTHPEDGADMLLDDPTLPLSAAERRHLAYLTLHHKGKVPPVGQDEVLARTDDPVRLLRVLGLLRAADALDNRALSRGPHAPPRVVFGLTHRSPGRPPTLHVACYLDQVTPKAARVYRRRKKFRLLESQLGCEVVPQVVASAAGVRAVA